MNKLTILVVASLSVCAAFYALSEGRPSPLQLSPVQEPTPAPWMIEECTEKLEVKCAISIEKTVMACAAAVETEGVDIIADIKCAKDLLSDEKDCWPCICAEAAKKGWHIIGC